MLSLDLMSQSQEERISILKKKTNKSSLLINEIYAAIQGESSYAGMPCVMVRTTGCHLRCSYCDTPHAFFAGQEMSLPDILHQVKSFNISLVELTGGEPLLQPMSINLLNTLVLSGYTTLIETSGAVAINRINRHVKVILDVKTPFSNEHERNIAKNLDILWPGCEVKFVIGNYNDYLYAKKICTIYDLTKRTHVLFSPIISMLDPKDLAEWILEDKLNVRLQLQIHRILYGEAPGK
jgi:7-carboxy-7-deazaguanine synthase